MLRNCIISAPVINVSLSVAMNAMNKVASHINEMQKLHEEYGAVFDQLINEQTGDKKEVNMIIIQGYPS